ncbi:hypothetical protein KY308_04170, partial [Candidatus Woesearchaeota archaeon]|nr:hypothetical protein [Candidatus Woesearchaeota archaeon]
AALFEGFLAGIIVGFFAWWLPPALINYSNNNYYIALFVALLPLWWVIILIFNPPKYPHEEGLSFKALRLIYVFALIIAIIYWALLPGLATLGITGEEILGQTVLKGPVQEQFKQNIQTGVKEIRSIPDKISAAWERQIYIATGGDYYSGQVEKNKQEPIGVYIENLRPADPTLYSDQKVVVWGVLKAKTILEEKRTVTTSCQADDPIKKIPVDGTTIPKTFDVLGYEELDLQCEFSPNRLSPGVHRVNVSATFDFETFSYMKSYFMDRDRMLDLRRQEIDPLDQYKITDKNPTAVYTNGPVGIGMDLPDMPVGISADNQVMPTLGITIENKWDGIIKKINRLIIYVPDGLSLDLASCDHTVIAAKDLEGDEVQEGFTAFELNPRDPLTTEIANHPTGSYRTFKCRVRTVDASKILGSAPITTKNFKVTVYYTYDLVKTLTIDVKKGTGVYVPTPSAPSAPSAPSESDISTYLMKFDTSKYEDRTYKQLLEATTGGKDNHELLASVIVVETGVENVPKDSAGCAGIMRMCPALAVRYNLCKGANCEITDFRMEVDRQMSVGASYLMYLKGKFKDYDDKDKFALAAYATGAPNSAEFIILRAIQITSDKLGKALNLLTWEEVKENINKELLKEYPEYKNLEDSQLDTKAEEIKSYPDIVLRYKQGFNGQNAFR